MGGCMKVGCTKGGRMKRGLRSVQAGVSNLQIVGGVEGTVEERTEDAGSGRGTSPVIKAMPIYSGKACPPVRFQSESCPYSLRAPIVRVPSKLQSVSAHPCFLAFIQRQSSCGAHRNLHQLGRQWCARSARARARARR